MQRIKAIKVIVWTINTKMEAEEYVAKDVDGIASDKPDIFQGISSSS
jgi:glycerophosphoryl diester phosphodiesterase